MHPNPRRIIPIVLLVAIIGGALWWLFIGRVQAQPAGLNVSGTVEATDVTIASEVSGRVAEVLVSEGDRVSAGQDLIRLDDSLIQAQIRQAEAALAAAQAQHAAAQANYDLLRAGAQTDQIAAAEEGVRAAQAAVAGAEAQLAQLLAGPRPAEIAAAEAAVAQAQAQQKIAQDAYDKTLTCVTVQGQEICPGLGTREEQARAALNAASEALAAAQRRLDQLKAGATRNEIDAARARVDAAKAQQAMAQAQLDLLKSGARDEQLAVAQAQVDAAQAQADAASASLDALKVQLGKYVLAAPVGGVILTRALEPGEIVLPGATLLTLSQIDSLTITVFVPEDRYGQIELGQSVPVSVDSFPDETFAATVVRIADRAEFTPRNVQTAEGRRTTVFAVKLALENLGGRLKPGMPADVSFEE